MPRSPKSVARQARRTQRREGKQAGRDNLGQMPQHQEYTRRPARSMQAEITPLTESQRQYDQLIKMNRIVYAVGPAGTGKTWFAVMRAAEALLSGEIDRLYLTRPAVEAGEKFGFLPGELGEKYEPYLAPFKDALEEKLGSGQLGYLLRAEVIRPVPLAFMRGRTIKNAWLLADEMQNATLGQHKMLLTRIGRDAKFIINGDPKQSDLPHGESGLIQAMEKVEHIAGISGIHFGRKDVVRDDICQEIVEAFET